MPVLVWEIGSDGPRSTVETEWEVFTNEEVRQEAEELDRQLDDVLDVAVETARRIDAPGVALEFARAWAVGRALATTNILDAPALQREPRHRLWLALARKCRVGVRSDGSITNEWHVLRPSSVREPRREGARLDYFEMCLWLAEQSFDDALATFGGSVRNVWQMLERPALRPLQLRSALKRFLAALPVDACAIAVGPTVFPELMKALRRRWPDRGPGSARRPVHLNEEALLLEVDSLLRPLLEVELADAQRH